MTTRLHRREQQARTRASLVEAAAHVFAERGFAGATIEDICESAGYSRGAFYANFSDKHELVRELLATRDSADWDELSALMRERPVDGPRWLADVATQECTLLPLRLELLLHSLRAGDPDAHQRHQAAHERERATAILSELGGGRQSLPPDRLALLALAMFDGLVLRAAADPTSRRSAPTHSFSSDLALTRECCQPPMRSRRRYRLARVRPDQPVCPRPRTRAEHCRRGRRPDDGAFRR